MRLYQKKKPKKKKPKKKVLFFFIDVWKQGKHDRERCHFGQSATS